MYLCDRMIGEKCKIRLGYTRKKCYLRCGICPVHHWGKMQYMEFNQLPVEVRDRVKEWLAFEYDPRTREEVQWLIDNDLEGLQEAFRCDMAFGTGGLRGLMGAGSNRVNIYTLRRVTLGLASYLRSIYGEAQELRVAIAYDSRNNSQKFAQEVANTLAVNGVRVYLMRGERPTPQLSFTVRVMRCQAGVVITASHNPKEYNGYKVYWADGGQVVAPHDAGIMAAVATAKNEANSKRVPAEGQVITLGPGIDEAYLNTILQGLHHPECIRAQAKMPIVYTPIHGTGEALVPQLLKRMGFANVQVVPKQRDPDGNFPTVQSPNPEDPDAMNLALQLANQTKAVLVMGTDPDSDRLGAYVRRADGEYERLNGNQLAVLLAYYTLKSLKEKGKLPKKGQIVRTVVTTRMLDALAATYKVGVVEVLTGFKYIAHWIQAEHNADRFIFGAEESHGYLAGTAVRDKDAVQGCGLLAEMAAWCYERGQNLVGLLEELYSTYGYWREEQRSLVLVGEAGREEIAQRMKRLREKHPTTLAGEKVVRVVDYLENEVNVDGVLIPQSDVLQIFTDAGSLITARPSGTEPKIKYYVGVQCAYQGWEASQAAGNKRCQALLEAVMGV